MSRINETSVVIHDCTIVWDSLTRPETAHDGSPKYVLKVVIPPNSPDLAEFSQLAQEKLQASKFNGTLPVGGRMPVGIAGPQEFNGMFPGWGVVSAKTKFMPTVHGEDVSILEPMQWAGMIYPGQKVNLLVDCYDYDNKNKGIGTGLQGVQILTSANAQRLALGGGGVDTSAAFGGQPAPAVGPYAPPGTPPAAQQYAAPVGQPNQAVQQGAPAQQPYVAPVQQPYVAPVTGYPQQSTDFLPPAPGAPLPGQPGYVPPQ